MQSGVLFLRSLSCSRTAIRMSGQLVQMLLGNWLSKVSSSACLPLLPGWGPFPATFHNVIKGAILHIFAFLKDRHPHVRLAGANAIGKLVEQSELWCCHSSWQGWGPFLAPFHDIIKVNIPLIIESLKDSNSDVRSAVVNAIGKLAEQSKWWCFNPPMQGWGAF